MPIPINKAYARLFKYIKDPTYRYFEIYGGRRSGKSHDISNILAYIAETTSGHFICAVRKYATSLKDSVFSRFTNAFKENLKVPYYRNKSDREFVLRSGSRIRCIGLDDPEKVKSLEGATIVWFEEATEFTEDDFDTIDAGLSPTKHSGKIFLTHNPVPLLPGSLHWIQRRFINIEHGFGVPAVKDNYVVLKTWYKNNAFCPESTIKVLERYKETHPQKYKMWALGEFTQLEGIILEDWEIVQEVPEGIELYGYGLDFGFSADPAACLAVYGHNDELWIKGHLYMTGLTNQQLYDKIIESGVEEHDYIVADSAEPKTIETLRGFGLSRIKGVEKKKNYKAEMANELRGYKIYVVAGDTDLHREVQTWAWERDRNGKQLPVPADGDDHYMDCLVMLMYDLIGRSVPRISAI